MSDEKEINTIISEIGNSTVRWGFGSSLGKTYGTIYFNEGITQDELKKKLAISLSSVSQSLQLLENTGLLKVIGKKGRKKMYCCEDSFGKIKRAMFENKIAFEINPMLETLEDSETRIKNKEQREKIILLKKKYEQMKRMLELILKLPIGK
jgi:DNA-binding transcriptional regulator GbsR (MarR family)